MSAKELIRSSCPSVKSLVAYGSSQPLVIGETHLASIVPFCQVLEGLWTYSVAHHGWNERLESKRAKYADRTTRPGRAGTTLAGASELIRHRCNYFTCKALLQFGTSNYADSLSIIRPAGA